MLSVEFQGGAELALGEPLPAQALPTASWLVHRIFSTEPGKEDAHCHHRDYLLG